MVRDAGSVVGDGNQQEARLGGCCRGEGKEEEERKKHLVA